MWARLIRHFLSLASAARATPAVRQATQAGAGAYWVPAQLRDGHPCGARDVHLGDGPVERHLGEFVIPPVGQDGGRIEVVRSSARVSEE